jgi:4'-phosphopantetheinyl transferase
MVRGALIWEGGANAGALMQRWSRPGDTSFSVRRRSLLARALLRRLLAESTGAESGWTFDGESSGRPLARRADGGRAPAIAISHSGGWVACAIATVGQIGIDIEIDRPGRDILGIAGLAFGAGERRDVERGGAGAFYRIWTAREALAKARGHGLAEAADGIDRVEGAPAAGVQLRQIGGEAWWLVHATPVEGLTLAVAYNYVTP